MYYHPPMAMVTATSTAAAVPIVGHALWVVIGVATLLTLLFALGRLVPRSEK